MFETYRYIYISNDCIRKEVKFPKRLQASTLPLASFLVSPPDVCEVGSERGKNWRIPPFFEVEKIPGHYTPGCFHLNSDRQRETPPPPLMANMPQSFQNASPGLSRPGQAPYQHGRAGGIEQTPSMLSPFRDHQRCQSCPLLPHPLRALRRTTKSSTAELPPILRPTSGLLS